MSEDTPIGEERGRMMTLAQAIARSPSNKAIYEHHRDGLTIIIQEQIQDTWHWWYHSWHFRGEGGQVYECDFESIDEKNFPHTYWYANPLRKIWRPIS